MRTNTKLTFYFKIMEAEIEYCKCIKRPEFKNSFHCIYSPEKFTLRPRDNILLNLKISVKAPDCLKAWINLLPTLKELGLAIEDHNWAVNKLKDKTIQLNILNKHFYDTITIKKIKNFHMFLLGLKFNHKIVTKYTTLT